MPINATSLNEILENKPFKRKDYVAMLLRFHPCHYTTDYEDLNIMYGEKRTKLRNTLGYIQRRRLLLNNNGSDDLELLWRYFENDDSNSMNHLLMKHNIDPSLVEEAEWTFFKSYSLENNGFHSPDINHRLYLTIGMEQRAFFANAFINECSANNIPYYFKVLTIKGQTDTVVIYIDNEQNLEATIGIINKIYSDPSYKKIKDSTKPTASHLYVVNDYIGYGFEPKRENEQISYTGLMKECAKPVEDKIELLRKRIVNDFYKGIVHQVNVKERPSADECRMVCKLPQKEKYKFFIRYFQYIIKVYGNDIQEILNEIEQNVEREMSNPHKTFK